MNEHEIKTLLAIRNRTVRSHDGNTIAVVLWTDTKTGQVELSREKLSFVSFMLKYKIPDDVFEV